MWITRSNIRAITGRGPFIPPTTRTAHTGPRAIPLTTNTPLYAHDDLHNSINPIISISGRRLQHNRRLRRRSTSPSSPKQSFILPSTCSVLGISCMKFIFLHAESARSTRKLCTKRMSTSRPQKNTMPPGRLPDRKTKPKMEILPKKEKGAMLSPRWTSKTTSFGTKVRLSFLCQYYPINTTIREE